MAKKKKQAEAKLDTEVKPLRVTLVVDPTGKSYIENYNLQYNLASSIVNGLMSHALQVNYLFTKEQERLQKMVEENKQASTAVGTKGAV